jgi:hypothetical protein
VTGGIEQAQIELERGHLGWMIWVTYRPVGNPEWCARRWDDTGEALTAGTARALGEAIERAEAGPG